MTMAGDPCESLRIDRLLWMLRLARSRSAAQAIVAKGHVRRNGQRVTRMAQPVCPGDVLTIPIGRSVRVIALDAIPSRRGPASEAQCHYHDLVADVGPSIGEHRVDGLSSSIPTLDARGMRP